MPVHLIFWYFAIFAPTHQEDEGHMNAKPHDSGDDHDRLQASHIESTEVQVWRLLRLALSTRLLLTLEMQDDLPPGVVHIGAAIQCSGNDGSHQQAGHCLQPVHPLDTPANGGRRAEKRRLID